MISFYSNTGWINTGVMLHYLDRIIKPALGPKGGALILDDYKAHWTEPVIDKANQLKLRLIKVPPGETSRFQPLDISVMGPMSKARERMYIEDKLLKTNSKDNIENALERAEKSYREIDEHTIVKGFKSICSLM